jgi:hypothetical protein
VKDTKFQISMTEKFIEDLKVLMEECGAHTRREYIMSALALQKAAIEGKKCGLNLTLSAENGTVVSNIIMPLLSNVKKA